MRTLSLRFAFLVIGFALAVIVREEPRHASAACTCGTECQDYTCTSYSTESPGTVCENVTNICRLDYIPCTPSGKKAVAASEVIYEGGTRCDNTNEGHDRAVYSKSFNFGGVNNPAQNIKVEWKPVLNASLPNWNLLCCGSSDANNDYIQASIWIKVELRNNASNCPDPAIDYVKVREVRLTQTQAANPPTVPNCTVAITGSGAAFDYKPTGLTYTCECDDEEKDITAVVDIKYEIETVDVAPTTTPWALGMDSLGIMRVNQTADAFSCSVVP